MEGQVEYMPPVVANLGLSCFKCFRDDEALRRCSGCKRVAYCSETCQSGDWPEHKSFCKAFKALDTDAQVAATFDFMFTEDPDTDMDAVNKLGDIAGVTEAKAIQTTLKRPLSIKERNLIGWQPRCMACAKTERMLRAEAPENVSAAMTQSFLKPCPSCRMTFYCSEEHWNTVEQIHSGQPCEDGHGVLSQCDINQTIRQDMRSLDVKSGKGLEPLTWSPERIVKQWGTMKGETWEDDIGANLRKEMGQSLQNLMDDPEAQPIPEFGKNDIIPSILRTVTEYLSMPLTILWALEKLSVTDEWSKKKSLTIHVLGAAQLEISGTPVFEEIMHRLPNVTTLKIVLCGPQLKEIFPEAKGRPMKMETCLECKKRQRERVFEHYPMMYHELTKYLGKAFAKPDLAVAFNSGLCDEQESWHTTYKAFAGNGTPIVFTSYNREEAEKEADILRGWGATLDPELGPLKNPWGSLMMKNEPNKVYGFYAVNGWLSGGFRL